MNRRGRWTVVSLVAAVATCGTGGPARGAVVEAHAEPGLLFGPGLAEVGVRPTVGGDVTTWWSPGAHLDLGLETGLAVTELPYGSNDGEPVIGKRGEGNPGYLNDSVTVMPRVLFGSRVALGPRTWLGAFVGSSWLVAGELGRVSLIPLPTGAVAVETRVGASGHYGVRAAVSYIPLHLDRGDALISTTLAFNWGE